MLLTPYLRALLPLLSAVAIGSALHALPPTFGAVQSGACETFTGNSQGNDPSQHMALTLCRDGDALEGVRISQGEAGLSVFHLSGLTDPSGIAHLQVSGVERDAPSEGWVSCSDDVFTFRWDAHANSLRGYYVSRQCDDTAKLSLTRR